MSSKINPLAEITKLKPAIWKKIQEYLPNKEPKEHYAMVREYPLRQGKYLRPGLVLLSAKMFGINHQKVFLTAAAMQVSEEWILIHDDFEDHSLERRSTKTEYCPALHIMHGDELAINAGDTLHVIMWKMLGDNVRLLGDKIGFKIYEKMNSTILSTLEGQFLELNWIRKNTIEISEQEYLKMIDIKAGAYTIIAPLQLGAIVAGQSDKELEKIKEWGIPFGRAFQIWDDVMNLTVKSEKQGKETAGDILEGKRTLILIHLLGKCSLVEKKKIIKIYAKKRQQKTEIEKNYVLNLMKEYGSIEYAKKIALDCAEKSKAIFDQNTAYLPNTKAKKIIRATIDFVVNRDR